MVYTLRFTSARGDNGEGFELSVIAAVLFGGVSIFGGRGSMIGVLLSLLIIGVLRKRVDARRRIERDAHHRHRRAAAFIGADTESRCALAGDARKTPGDSYAVTTLLHNRRVRGHRLRTDARPNNTAGDQLHVQTIFDHSRATALALCVALLAISCAAPLRA